MGLLKYHKFFLNCIFLLGIALIATQAMAKPKVDFAGFATLAYSKTLSGQDNTAGEGKDKEGEYYGMSKDGDIRQLSLLGLRADVRFDDSRLNLTAQAVIYGNDNYKPKFDWIYASYDLGAGWSVAAGRTRTPLFMYSAYQDVSYAYTWLKPPFSVYGIPQFKSVDGLKVVHQGMMGDWSSDVQIWYGTLSERLAENGLDSTLELKDVAGISWDVEHAWLRFHTAYMFAKSSIDINTNNDLAKLSNALATLDNALAGQPILQQNVKDLYQQLQWENSEIHFASLGVSMDFSRFFLNAEATYIDIEESVAAPKSMQSYYMTFGVRPVKDWTLSLSLIRDRDREHKGLKKDYAAVIKQVEAADPSLVSNIPDGNSFAVAVVDRLQRLDTQGIILSTRWDFHRSASAKLEYLAEERRYGDSNTIYRPQAVRIGVDVVF